MTLVVVRVRVEKRRTSPECGSVCEEEAEAE